MVNGGFPSFDLRFSFRLIDRDFLGAPRSPKPGQSVNWPLVTGENRLIGLGGAREAERGGTIGTLRIAAL